MRTPTLALLLFLSLSLPSLAAGVYRYTDEDGTIVYTNSPPAKSKRAQKLKGTLSRAPSPDRPVDARSAPAVRADINDAIAEAAKRYEIPESLIRAVMHTESNFNPMAVSSKGATGLMQLMPATAADMYVTDIFDIRQNVDGGTRYLRMLANLYNGDMVKMLAAYNAGPDAVRRYGGTVPPFAETQGYVRKVVKLYFQYKQQMSATGAAPSSTTTSGSK